MTRILSPALPAHTPPKEWADYWEDFNAEDCFHREPSKLYVEKLVAAVPLRPEMRILDFGCGFGFAADLIADRVSEVWVWDAAANMRQRAMKLLARRSNCHLLDLSDANEAAVQPRFDLILVNSVVQYMTRQEFAARLAEWRQRRRRADVWWSPT